MHELSITVGLVDAVSGRVAELGGDVRVTRVGLEIGRLSGVVADSLRFCFDLVAAGTALDGARLDIAEPPGRGRCRSCGAELDLPDLLTPCGCGSCEIELVGGEEVRIIEVEVKG